MHAAAGSTAAFEAFLADWSTAHHRHFDRYLAGEASYEQQALARIREALGDHLADRSATDLWTVYYTSYEAAWSLFPDVTPYLDRVPDRQPRHPPMISSRLDLPEVLPGARIGGQEESA